LCQSFWNTGIFQLAFVYFLYKKTLKRRIYVCVCYCKIAVWLNVSGYREAPRYKHVCVTVLYCLAIITWNTAIPVYRAISSNTFLIQSITNYYSVTTGPAVKCTRYASACVCAWTDESKRQRLLSDTHRSACPQTLWHGYNLCFTGSARQYWQWHNVKSPHTRAKKMLFHSIPA